MPLLPPPMASAAEEEGGPAGFPEEEQRLPPPTKMGFRKMLSERTLKVTTAVLLAFALFHVAITSYSIACVLATALVCILGGLALARDSSMLLLAFIGSAFTIAALYIVTAILLVMNVPFVFAVTVSWPPVIASTAVQVVVLCAAGIVGIFLRKHIGKKRAETAEQGPGVGETPAPLATEGLEALA